MSCQLHQSLLIQDRITKIHMEENTYTCIDNSTSIGDKLSSKSLQEDVPSDGLHIPIHIQITVWIITELVILKVELSRDE